MFHLCFESRLFGHIHMMVVIVGDFSGLSPTGAARKHPKFSRLGIVAFELHYDFSDFRQPAAQLKLPIVLELACFNKRSETSACFLEKLLGSQARSADAHVLTILEKA